jgi:DNA-binding MarR family transcriptional regulator
MIMSERELANLRAVLLESFSSLDAIERRTVDAANMFRATEAILRRSRDRHFPSGYFADVAWDILLDLDKAARDGRQYAVTDIGVEAKAPLTTVLRYLGKLEQDGYLERISDTKDKRRSFVRLTDFGQSIMNAIFDEVVRHNRSNTEETSYHPTTAQAHQSPH